MNKPELKLENSLRKLFFIVPARDKRYVTEKIMELERLRVPYIIVCGERVNHPRVVYRAPIGKYDAVNFGAALMPKDVNIIVLRRKYGSFVCDRESNGGTPEVVSSSSKSDKTENPDNS
jgi:hypothetical protein